MTKRDKHTGPTDGSAADKNTVYSRSGHEGQKDGMVPAADDTDEVMERLPGQIKDRVTQFFGVHGMLGNPVASKLTPEHIDKLIDNKEKQSQREERRLASVRRYTLLYTALAVMVFFGLYLVVGREDPDFFKEILTYLGTFAAGCGVGFGYTLFRTWSG